MTKSVTCLAIAIAALSASVTAFAGNHSGTLAGGEEQARQLLRLMDTDQNQRVSKEEFMRFMETEFDRLDVSTVPAASALENFQAAA